MPSSERDGLRVKKSSSPDAGQERQDAQDEVQAQSPPEVIDRLKDEFEQSKRALSQARTQVESLLLLEHGAIVTVDPSGSVVQESGEVLRTTGLSAQELVHPPDADLRLSTLAVESLSLEETPIARALAGETLQDIELHYHFANKDATVLMSVAPVRMPDGRIEGAVLRFYDRMRYHQEIRRLELLNVLTSMLSTGSLERSHFQQLARLVGEVMGGWTVMGLTRPHSAELEIVATFHPTASLNQELASVFGRIRIVMGKDPGMGRVAATGQPMLFSHAPSFDTIPTADDELRALFLRLGCDSLLIAPLQARGNTLGVLLLVSLPQWPLLTREDLDYTQQLLDRVAVTLDNVSLVADLRMKERRMRILAQVGRTFSSSLDLEHVAQTVAHQLAESFADFCTVGLLDEGGKRLFPAAVYHRDPSMLKRLQALCTGLSLEVGEDIPGQVVASQSPVLMRPARFSLEAPQEGNEAYRRLHQELQLEDYLCVPLSVGGMPLGYLDLGTTRSGGRKLQDFEVGLARELADRAASALQNAQLFEELQDVVHAKDDWLSVASHELKTPLTPLQVLLQLTLRRLRRGETIEADHIDRCLAQVGKLTRLINDLLDISKVEMGQLELCPEVVDLRELAERVVNAIQAETKDHEIILTQGKEPLQIEADRGRIEQVLTNLLQNSVKYSPEGGRIDVTLHREAVAGMSRVVATVRDHGIGIPESEQPRLFQRYFRGSNVPEHKFGGLGLGLWMSNEIVVRHHGQLRAKSSPGKGSQFTFWLPMAGAYGLSSRRLPLVLVVDDDAAVLDTAAECLSEEGYQVAVARNGQVALTFLNERRVRVVLVDLMMPMMDGWELIRRIRRLMHGEDIKVIVMSGTRDLCERAQELGAWDILPKPFTLQELLSKVARAMGRKPQGLELHSGSEGGGDLEPATPFNTKGGFADRKDHLWDVTSEGEGRYDGG